MRFASVIIGDGKSSTRGQLSKHSCSIEILDRENHCCIVLLQLLLYYHRRMHDVPVMQLREYVRTVRSTTVS